MNAPLPPRRLAGSAPGVLLAVLLVFLRLLAPATAAMPQAGSRLAAFDRMAREAICHAAPDEDGQPTDHGDDDCSLCPACHLVSVAALPLPAGPSVPGPEGTVLRLAARPPPATGPPGRPRGAAQPTGPPSLSA